VIIGNPDDKTAASVHKQDTPDVEANFTPREIMTVPKVPPSPTDSTKSDGKRYDPNPPWKKRIEIAGFCVLVVYAAFTVLMYFANKKAANAAKSAAETASNALVDSRKFSMLQQRPYIVPKSGSTPAFVNAPISGTAPATVFFSNVGHIPAQSVMGYARLVHITFPPNQQVYNPFNEIDKTIADIRANVSKGGFVPRMDVAPGAEYIITKELAAPLSADDIRNLENPSGNMGWLVFAGFTTYTDTFGEPMETEFCWMWFGPDPRVWHYCPTHNTIK
jgi:hypothetical protein